MITIQERIEYYRGQRLGELKLIEERKHEIASDLAHASYYGALRNYLDEALREVNDRIKRIEQYDLLIKEFEDQARAEERSNDND